MHTLIVAGVIAVVLLLVVFVIQYAGRTPQDVSRWSSVESGDLDWDDGTRPVTD